VTTTTAEPAIQADRRILEEDFAANRGKILLQSSAPPTAADRWVLWRASGGRRPAAAAGSGRAVGCLRWRDRWCCLQVVKREVGAGPGVIGAGAVVLVLVLSACVPPGDEAPGTDATKQSASPALAAPEMSARAREQLAPIRVDDNPQPSRPYTRTEWPSWVDLDGDGCDTREALLIAGSTTRAQVDPIDCSVVAGDWVSSYDGMVTDQPGELDVDHVVSLEDVHTSGGWAWTAAQRRAFANDTVNLIVVSASSNRSKGSKGPADWRPPRPEAWCSLARSWTAAKVTYRLTATTADRDAAGQMLDTCPAPSAAPTTLDSPMPTST